jgi:hypothetical protein
VLRFRWHSKAATKRLTSLTSTAKETVLRAEMAVAIAVRAGAVPVVDAAATVAGVDAARGGKLVVSD